MCQYFQWYCGNLFLLLEKQAHFFQNHSKELLKQALQRPSEVFTQQSHVSAPWVWQNKSCEPRLLLHAMHAKIDMEKASFQRIYCFLLKYTPRKYRKIQDSFCEEHPPFLCAWTTGKGAVRLPGGSMRLENSPFPLQQYL